MDSYWMLALIALFAGCFDCELGSPLEICHGDYPRCEANEIVECNGLVEGWHFNIPPTEERSRCAAAETCILFPRRRPEARCVIEPPSGCDVGEKRCIDGSRTMCLWYDEDTSYWTYTKSGGREPRPCE